MVSTNMLLWSDRHLSFKTIWQDLEGNIYLITQVDESYFYYQIDLKDGFWPNDKHPAKLGLKYVTEL